MALTVNGQKVIAAGDYSGPGPHLRKWKIPGTDRHLVLRDGAMGFLLVHVAVWFDQEIERLDRRGQPWDEWGHAVRPVRGQTSGYSQHAGGVAEDLNATLHPRGVSIHKTFTNKQIRKIRRRMKLYNGAIRWGGEWSVPDGMHFEIAPVSSKKCDRIARLLLLTPRGRRITRANPGSKKAIKS